MTAPLDDQCGFDMDWSGTCKSPKAEGEVSCAKHMLVSCGISGCDNSARSTCPYTMSIAVCGFPLCDEHTYAAHWGHYR